MSGALKSLAQAMHDARPRVVAALAVHCRDLDLAEDAFAESAAKCLKLPERPGNVTAWLITVGKRWIVDQLRRRASEARAIEEAGMVSQDNAQVLQFPEPIADERLRLIFICCHPAIATEARVALALKVICGLPVSEIARVFLTSESTMFQRITRAKRKIAEAGIAFELPPRKAWDERLEAVLLSLELAYTVAYQDAGGERASIDGANAGDEIARLAALLCELVPDEPEVLGLGALITLAKSRERARIDSDGAMVPLSRQDSKLWDPVAIEQARRWLDQAARFAKSGPYQIMASIHLTHAQRVGGGEVDWGAIVRLYDVLALIRPGPVVALNRAVALSYIEGPAAGLLALGEIDAPALGNSRAFFAAKADLLARDGQGDAAKEAYQRALGLDPPRAERLFLTKRLGALSGD